MLLFVVVLALTLQPGLGQPCVEVLELTRYKKFLKHHLNNNSPKSEEIGEWQKFITKIKTWGKKKQSFFPEAEYNKVIGVCSTGKRYPNPNIYGKDNLCISNEPLAFITVKVDTVNKEVTGVTPENKHVILACEKIKDLNKCLPVHFEPNKKNAVPDDNQEDCS